MRRTSILICTVLFLLLKAYSQEKEILIYHLIQTDRAGKIVPWYDENPGKSYDHVINLVWNFWDQMRMDMNGLPYYMNHQVWNPKFNDPRGIGGDQFAMALSSWQLYYPYSGNERVKANMFFIADYYISHGISPGYARWPNIPFPYNTLIYSGIYDGDMRNGRGVAQPDKAASFGLELVHLYKISLAYNVGENKYYLEAAEKIANTLAAHIRKGNINYSPLPYKVNVFTGEIVLLRNHDFTGTWIDSAGYTSNWAPTMQLYLELIKLKTGKTEAYRKCFDILLNWMKAYPMKENKWGPFFEDVDWWSETQINAMTFARFIMEHREYFPEWKNDVQKIIAWSHQTFGNDKWKKYGVVVTNEQTVYQSPAQSHSSRQAADELLYVSLSGDKSFYENAVRELNWATYMVDFDGKNRFPGDEPWLTDGYGDYVRHYLRAMDAIPSLAPPDEDHIISSTSIIQQADYEGSLKKFFGLNFENVDSSKVKLFYRTFDLSGTEKITLRKKPVLVLLDNKPMLEKKEGEGYEWSLLQSGGLLVIRRENGSKVILMK
ncbi:MAG: hypothetical protein WCI54_00215 [Bacteroidia bacterium]